MHDEHCKIDILRWFCNSVSVSHETMLTRVCKEIEVYSELRHTSIGDSRFYGMETVRVGRRGGGRRSSKNQAYL